MHLCVLLNVILCQIDSNDVLLFRYGIQSLLNDPVMMSVGISLLLLFIGFLRNDYGELSRALVSQ